MRATSLGKIRFLFQLLLDCIEMADKDDIMASIELLTACLKELDQHDWSH